MSKGSHSRLLLTGSNGFLGTALAKRLVDDARYQLVVSMRHEAAESVSGSQPIIVGDLGANTDWAKAVSGVGVVIHTAARVHVMNDSAHEPLTEYRKINVEGTLSLAHQAVTANVKRLSLSVPSR